VFQPRPNSSNVVETKAMWWITLAVTATVVMMCILAHVLDHHWTTLSAKSDVLMELLWLLAKHV